MKFLTILTALLWGVARAQCDNAIADFYAPPVCAGQATVYANFSQGFSANALYEWDYESDGAVDFIGFNPPPFTFPGPGEYQTTLTVVDENGCTGVVFRAVDVLSSDVGFSFYESVCAVDGPFPLVGNAAAGVFYGQYVYSDDAGENYYFDPSGAMAPDVVTIYYEGYNQNQCFFSTSRTVYVQTPTTATITGLAPSYCTGPACVALNGFPAGGFFSGPGVSGNLFCPGAAGPGTHTLTYQSAGGDGCPFFTSRTVVVRQTPTAQILGAESSYCPQAPCDTLTGIPAGGTFSGPGIIGNRFCPALAGLGTHTIRYSGSQNGCAYFSTVQVTVAAPAATAAISGLSNLYCSNSLCVRMFGTPEGGTFSGNGVIGDRFCPGSAGPGTHVIGYTVNLGDGCVVSTTRTVTVNAAPTATLSGLQEIYCLPTADCSVMSGTPAGGNFTGPGVLGDVFCPLAAGPGTHTIRYTGRINGCSYVTTKTVVVKSPVSVSILAPDRLCQTDEPVAIGVTLPGGTLSGPGLDDAGVFDPASLAPGSYLLAYTGVYEGCAYQTYRVIEVAPAPQTYVLPLEPKYCRTDTLIALVGYPVGGTFDGDGVVEIGGQYFFNPVLAEAGFHVFTYSGTTTDGCPYTSYAATATIEPPVPQISNLNRYYCSLDAPVVLDVYPPDAEVLGTGSLVDGVFYPGAFVGSHTVTVRGYESNCYYERTFAIDVAVEPVVDITVQPGFDGGPGVIRVHILNAAVGVDYLVLINGDTAHYGQSVEALVFGRPSGLYTVETRLGQACSFVRTVTLLSLDSNCLPPTNLQFIAAPDFSGGRVRWQAYAGAESYTVRYRELDNPNWTYVNVSAPEMVFPSLNANATYRIEVASECFNGLTSEFAGYYFTLFPPQAGCGNIAPAVTSVYKTGVTTAGITFTLVQGAIAYEVRYRAGTQGEWQYTASPQNSAALLGLTSGLTYEIQVRAVCSDGVFSPWSSPATYVACPPPSATLSVVGSIVTAQWATYPTATGYTVAWRLNEPGAAWYQVALPANVSIFTLPQLLPNRNYLFRMRARCGQIVGSWSGEQGFSTTAPGGRLAAASVSGAELFVYPNPNAGVFSVRLPAGASIFLRLFDMSGKCVAAVERSASEFETEIELGREQPLTSGLYLLRGESFEGVWTKKIVVK